MDRVETIEQRLAELTALDSPERGPSRRSDDPRGWTPARLAEMLLTLNESDRRALYETLEKLFTTIGQAALGNDESE